MRATTLLCRTAAMAGFLALGACTTKTVVTTPQGQPASGVAPAMVLERFLAAANSKDLTTMGNLFGTLDGPVTGIDAKDNVEKRMFALATVLRHDDYKIEGEEIVPGRQSEALQLNVQITRGKEVVSVPFFMVRAKNDTWLGEDFKIQKLTYNRQ